MDVAHMKEFISLVEHGNIPDAADALYISPSTLSLHIRAMEEELGYQLFERTARTMELNENGLIFLGYARTIVSTFDEYRARAKEFAGESGKRITFGTLSTTSLTPTESIILDFYNKHRDIKINIISRDYRERILDYLIDGTIDFALLYFVGPVPDNVICAPLFEDSVVAVIPAENPLSEKSTVTVDDLRGESIITQNRDTFISKLMADHFKKHGVSINMDYVLNSGRLIMDFMEYNSGIGLMMGESARGFERENVAIRDIEPELAITYSMLYRKNLAADRAETVFMRYIADRFHVDSLPI